MALAFHTIWLGGCPPLRTLDHLAHLARLAALQEPSPGAMEPILWLDGSAHRALLERAPLPVCPVPDSAVPAALRHRARTLLPASPLPHPWLRLDHPTGVCHLPLRPLEALDAELARPWRSLPAAVRRLEALGQSPAGAAFLENELGWADPGAAALRQDPTALLAYLGTLIAHAQGQWAAHGLLCLPADLLRLLVLAWRPGAYGDLGDVAGRLRRLPSAADAGPHGFCAHHTVAVENDLILCLDPELLQAITLATALWSWRHGRAIAQRLGLDPNPDDPAGRLRQVLPHLDRRLPQPPDLAPLLQPPWTLLADTIAIAYGAGPSFHPPAALARFTAARRGKELLINDVGGFTGYQKAAHHLMPENAATWARCDSDLGLRHYAPQLGWKTYGFGRIDRLVGLGQRLQNASGPTAAAAAVHADLALLADELDWNAAALEPIARRCAQLHDLLSRAHHHPTERAHWLAQVEALCHTP